MTKHRPSGTAGQLTKHQNETLSTADEDAVVSGWVAAAMKRRKPIMALAALVRHAAQSESKKKHLRERAEAELRTRLQQVATPSAPVAAPEAWLTVREAAQWLARDERTVTDQLHSVDGRRRLGWPWWDGHAWRIAPAAVDPMRRAAFMVTLPDIEPTPELLPHWCERTEPVNDD